MFRCSGISKLEVERQNESTHSNMSHFIQYSCSTNQQKNIKCGIFERMKCYTNKIWHILFLTVSLPQQDLFLLKEMDATKIGKIYKHSEKGL